MRKRVKLTPAPGLPGGHNYTLNTFDARAIASPGPLPLFASSPVLLSGATVPLPRTYPLRLPGQNLAHVLP